MWGSPGRRQITTSGHRASVKRRTGIAWWLVRILGGLIAIPILCFLGLVAFYFIIVAPRERTTRAEATRAAAAFKRLGGKERRLAIYDAFIAQIDQHYYDQKFSGFDWPKLRRDWRPKAALASDDWHLYWDVLFQVTLKFPASHVSVSMPGNPIAPAAVAAPTPERPNRSELCDAASAGVQIVPLRRGKGQGFVVGEVLAGSPAARAGIVPGWSILKFSEKVDRSGGVMKATLLRLAPDQMHALENTGTASLVAAHPKASLAEARTYAASLKTEVSFNFPCKSPRPAFETKTLPGGIRYIRFDAFEPALIQKVAQALKQTGNKGAVLDLRFNHGGYTLLLLNTLLPPGTPVYRTKDASGVHVIGTERDTTHYRGPLAILTGIFSASAAEISAAVLKGDRRAIIVGRRTNGSVLGARFYPLPDGGQVELPVEDVELLDGTRLEGTGVAPNIEVYPTIEQLRSGQDVALLMAIKALARH